MKLFPQEVRIEESVVVPRAATEVFEFAIEDLATLGAFVEKTFPLPGVVKAEIVGGGRITGGSVRRVYLSNGGLLDEKVEVFRKPSLMKYRQIKGFPFPISLIARTGGGEYEFVEENGKTKFTWRAYVVPASSFSFPILLIIAKWFTKKLQRKYLANVQRALDQSTVYTSQPSAFPQS